VDGWSATRPLTKIMEGRTAIKRRSSFYKMNRICELETATAFFRQLQATLVEKRGGNVAPAGIRVRRRRNRQRRPINGVRGSGQRGRRAALEENLTGAVMSPDGHITRTITRTAHPALGSTCSRESAPARSISALQSSAQPRCLATPDTLQVGRGEPRSTPELRTTSRSNRLRA
jgi:hypothetical protein